MSSARLTQQQQHARLTQLNETLGQIEASLRDVAYLRQALDRPGQPEVYHAFGGVFFQLAPDAKEGLKQLKKQQYEHLESEYEATQQQILGLLVPS